MKQIITTGHFNLITPAHVYFFKTLKRMAEEVIVFLDDDSSNDLKKWGKAILTWEERKQIVSSIRFVDEVRKYSSNQDIFDYIMSSKGHMHDCCFAKGSDYNLDTICQEQRGWFDENGVPIMFVPLLKGYSTTKMVEEIARRNNE